MKIGPVDLDWIANNLDRIGELLLEHIFLTTVAIGIGLVISFAFALLIRNRPRLYGPIISATGILYAIPSLALFALLTPITGLGTVLTAEIALVSYTLVILVRNIVTALEGVSPDVIEAATAMGYTRGQRLWRVELPIALPIIVAGLRIATVTTIGLVTVATLIGMGGLGYLIVNVGIQRSFPTATLTGVVAVVALSVLADTLLMLLQRRLTPWAQAQAG